MKYIKHRSLAGLTALFVLFLGVEPGVSQEKPDVQLQPQGNPFARVFIENYTSPPIRTIEVRGEDQLDAMIRDGKLEISDQDAVRLALANNIDINVLRYTPYLQLWGIESGRAVLNPTIEFNPLVNRNVNPATSALQGTSSVLNLNNSFTLNVHKPFKPGTDFDFNFNAVRTRTNNTFSNLNPSIASLVSIGITQHLLQGFGDISRGRFLRVARNNYDISVENFSTGVMNIVTGVLNTYWNLVFNEEDIKVKEASLKLAQITLEQTQIQEQVGTMAPLDVLQAQAQVASVNQELVVARYNRRITEDQLKKLISSRADPGLVAATIVPTSKALPPAAPGDAQAALQRALETRPEIKAQTLNQQNNRIQVDYTHNQLKPVLDFSASYLQNGLGGDTVLRDYTQGIFGAPIIGVMPGGFSDSLDSLFNGRNVGYSLGLTLRIPIGNDQARADSAQAQIAYRQGEESLRALRQQIALQVRQAYDTVELNQASVQAAQVAVDYQEKRLQGEQDKYMLGASTTFLVLQAQRDLQNAQSILLQAKIAWIQSRVNLDHVVGDTLTANNILLMDALNLPRK